MSAEIYLAELLALEPEDAAALIAESEEHFEAFVDVSNWRGVSWCPAERDVGIESGYWEEFEGRESGLDEISNALAEDFPEAFDRVSARIFEGLE